MKTIVEAAAVLIVGILPYVFGSVMWLKEPEYYKRFTPADILMSTWVRSLSSIAIVLLIALDQSNGTSSIGLHLGDINSLSDAFGGAAAVVWLLIILRFVRKVLGSKTKQQMEKEIPLRPYMAEVLRYDDWQRLAFLSVLPFSVIGEDLICRGYLVLLLGSKTGAYIPWIFLSIMLSVSIHLYQGRDLETIAFHIVAASFLIGLALYTQSIMTAIGAHLYYDVLWAIGVWRRKGPTENRVTPIILDKRRNLGYSAFIITNGLILCIALLSLSWKS